MREGETIGQGETMSDTANHKNKACQSLEKQLEQWLLEGDGTSGNRGLNQEQRAAVTSSVNTVTAAGAGAGKTFVLARRYAYLVCVKKMKVSEILTLTFTRKATAEMYSRIYQTLLTMERLFGTAEAKQAVADFHSARIQTLDSYCSSIIRQSVGQYGIKPDFSIDDQQAGSMATQMALPFVLSHRHNPAIQMIATTTFSRLDNLARELFARTIITHSNIATPVNFTETVEKQLQYARQEFLRIAGEIDRLVYQLQQMVEDEGRSKSTFIPKLLSAVDLFQQEEWETSALDLNDTETAIRFCKAVERFVGLRLNGQHTKPWNHPLKTLREQTFPLLTSLTNLLYRQQELRELARLLDEFQSLYNRSKRQAGILTFADAAALALDTLKNHREIRQAEKESYKAIMIDEFQDDNKLQKDLLYALAEGPDTFNQGRVPPECLAPGKLFFVGDEKQSIYRFRGADVSVFRGLSRELVGNEETGLSRELVGNEETGLSRELVGNEETGLSRELVGNEVTGAALSLSYNYRSHPTLIAAFNTIFGGLPYQPGGRSHIYPEAVFMADTEATPDYEATYQEVLAGKSTEGESPQEKSRRRVHLCLFKAPEEEEETFHGECLPPDQCEAHFVAGKIKELVDAGRNPSQIAILFRSTTKQHLFETALKNLSIPYSAEATVNFFQDAPTNDILSFLTLCLYPANQTAYSTLLRSPFVGLSKEGVEILLAAQTDTNGSSLAAQTDTKASPNSNNGTHTIFNQADSHLLSNHQEAQAFIQGCQIYHQLAPKALTMPITELVSHLWYRLGYHYKTMEQEATLQYAPLYDKLFHLAAQADAKGTSLAAFVQTLQQEVDNQGKIDDMDIPLERGSGVQLMTIHKSKGLEFPVVFLANSNGRPKANQNDAAVYHNRQWGISVNLPRLRQLGDKAKENYFYLEAKKEEEGRTVAELRRTLYVALTRAEEEVYITGSASPDKKTGQFNSNEKPNTLLQLLFPLINTSVVFDDLTTDTGSTVQEIPVAADSPFDLQWIPAVTRQKIQDRNGAERQAPPYQLAQSLEHLYQGEPILPAVEESPYRSPSHLAPKSPEYWQEQNESTSTTIPTPKEASPSQAYSEIAQLVNSTKKSDGTTSFTHADFGTCVHLYLEAALNKQLPVVPTSYLQHLNKGNQQKLHQLCTTMAQSFLCSSTGQAVQDAPWRKTEYSFKMRLGRYIINGSIDLIYQDHQGRLHIVDYKTDQEERPENYYVQQSAYRKAAAAIFNQPEETIYCSLYYLRSGNAVDITQGCATVNLEELVELSAE